MSWKTAAIATHAGHEILSRRIRSRMARWVQEGDSAAPTEEATANGDKKRGKKTSKKRKPILSRHKRGIIVTCAPALLLFMAVQPRGVGAILATCALHIILLGLYELRPAIAVLTMAATVAILWPPFMLCGMAVWLPLAYRAGKRPETPEEEVSTPGDTSNTHPLLLLCAHLTGPTLHVHLTALAAAALESGACPTQDPREAKRRVRDTLHRLGVAVRPSVRAPEGAVPGARVAVHEGVHREDLEAVIGPLDRVRPATPPDPATTSPTGPLTSDVANPPTPVGNAATPLTSDVAGAATAVGMSPTPTATGENAPNSGHDAASSTTRDGVTP